MPASQPTSLDFIHHMAIKVEAITESVQWYQSRFRCQIDYQDDTWALLSFANMKLALVLPEQHPPHIAFVTPDAEDYGELKLHRDGTRSVYVQDNSGNVVELLEAASVTTAGV